ncbi:hypothetical protein FM037_16600 [Shewanella psychropiezotolerans]|uniref:Uncharacterized protein n=1 Tax=Shewanella psychropiezotolerans TaxID=2593655 RepID=A0ABX5WZJ6_9GAMM|nr:hypothetical protein [Shewanella psychropiezotolerans]QDO84530.1 hypothetical protein FM037_16600 [Shewanella psychropiezotolerans]
MGSYQQLKEYHDQLRAKVNITPFLQWYDTRIDLWQHYIIEQPEHAASYRKLIKEDRKAKQRMMSEHQAIIERVARDKQ